MLIFEFHFLNMEKRYASIFQNIILRFFANMAHPDQKKNQL